MGDEALLLAGLALTAFLAATVVPASSEAALGLMAAAKTAPLVVLWCVAGAANTAGSCVNWLLGRFAEGFRNRRWFPASEAQLTKAQLFYQRWGWPSLLLSWVPFIGDPITVIAGFLRTPFALFLVVVAVAKFGRYAVIIWLVSGN